MPTPARIPPKGLRIDFDVDAFNLAVETKGCSFLWERASKCPCVQHDEGGAPALICPICAGEGWEYWGPTEIKGIVKSTDLDNDTMIAFGDLSTGTLMLTVRAEYQPNFRDRFTNLESAIRYTEITHRQGTVMDLRYPIAAREVTLHPASPLSLTPEGDGALPTAARVKAAMAASRAAPVETMVQSVVRLRLRDGRDAGGVLELGIDFDVTPAGQLDWAKGAIRETAPVEGGAFAVDYYHHPRYLVDTFEHVERLTRIRVGNTERLARLPVQIKATLESLRRGE